MNPLLRLFVSCGLVLAHSLAFAAWVEVEKFEDNTRVFVDPASAQRSGDIARVTHLVRWGEVQADEGIPVYRSTVVHSTYDCEKKLEKFISSMAYSGTMGNGTEVLEDDNAAPDWYSISPDSMEEKLWQAACRGKEAR